MSSQIQVTEGVDRDGSGVRRGGPTPQPTVDAAAAERPILSMTVRKIQALVVALAPAVMMAGLVYHPHIGSPTDAGFLTRLAAAVNADPGRWAVAHLIVAVGSGLIALAFLAIRSHMRAAGEDKWSLVGIPFIVMGSTLYALLPAMEFAPLTASISGADAAAAQAALFPYFVPTLMIGAGVFFLGACGFAVGIVRGTMMISAPLRWIVAGSLVIMAVARFVPLMAFQMYVQSVAGIVALWPLAYVMWMKRA